MPHIIPLPKFEDPRGNLSFIEENDYKSLRGAAIMDRYQEKEARSMVEEESTEFISAFDELFDTQDIQTPDDLFDRI